MTTFIIVGVVIYLIIGVGLLIHAVKSDPWGGLLIHFAIPLILFYPYFIVRSCLRR